MLYNTVVRTRKAHHDLPVWLDEGYAEVFRIDHLGVPGNPMGRPDWRDPGPYQRLARGADRYALERVIRLARNDFASEGQELAHAHAYTLVRFLLEGESGRWREGFLDFLRGVRAGRAEADDLELALGVTIAELESAWLAHVDAAVAGG